MRSETSASTPAIGCNPLTSGPPHLNPHAASLACAIMAVLQRTWVFICSEGAHHQLCTSRLCSSSPPSLLASSSLETFRNLYTYEPSLLLNSSTKSLA